MTSCTSRTIVPGYSTSEIERSLCFGCWHGHTRKIWFTVVGARCGMTCGYTWGSLLRRSLELRFKTGAVYLTGAHWWAQFFNPLTVESCTAFVSRATACSTCRYSAQCLAEGRDEFTWRLPDSYAAQCPYRVFEYEK